MFVPKVDSTKQQQDLLPVDLLRLKIAGRPGEFLLFKAFHPEAESIAVPIQDLQYRPVAAAEQEQVAREWLLIHHGLCYDRKPIDLLAHVRVARAYKDPYFAQVDIHYRLTINASTKARVCLSVSG